MRTVVRSMILTVALCLVVAVPAAQTAEVRAGAIVISDAWTRPTFAGMSMGVAYFLIRNDGSVADVLVSASTTAASRVEFHRTTFSDGIARMRPLERIPVPARGRVAVEPNGIHLMLVDLKQPLTAGARIPLVLEFRKAGRIVVELAVENRGS